MLKKDDLVICIDVNGLAHDEIKKNRIYKVLKSNETYTIISDHNLNSEYYTNRFKKLKDSKLLKKLYE